MLFAEAMAAARAKGILGSIAANLRAARERLGWTQEALAEAADVDTRFVQRVESGSVNFGVLALVVLAEALGTKPAGLLKPAPHARRKPGRPAKATARRSEGPGSRRR